MEKRPGVGADREASLVPGEHAPVQAGNLHETEVLERRGGPFDVDASGVGQDQETVPGQFTRMIGKGRIGKMEAFGHTESLHLEKLVAAQVDQQSALLEGIQGLLRRQEPKALDEHAIPAWDDHGSPRG